MASKALLRCYPMIKIAAGTAIAIAMAAIAKYMKVSPSPEAAWCVP